MAKFFLSDIDSERFRIRYAKAERVDRESVDDILSFCRHERVDMLMARCNASDFDAIHEMERSGFRMMDTIVYYGAKLDPNVTGRPSRKKFAVTIENGGQDEADEVARVARRCFEGYFSHYHADPWLDDNAVLDAFADWAESYCRDTSPGEILVARDRDRVLRGFLTVKMNTKEEGEGALFAVSPDTQGKGIGTALIQAAMDWCRDNGGERFIISTQVINFASQRIWANVGLRAFDAVCTFHYWPDRGK